MNPSRPQTDQTILVTGGAGFIGSHLVEHLLQAGRKVIIIDDLSTGEFANIEHLEREYGPTGQMRFICDSVLHERVTEDAVRECDGVFHLASAVGVRLIMEQPVQTIQTITGGTDVVLRCAARYRRPTVIFSTSEVYGKSTDAPFREDGDRLQGPTTRHRWAYACAKSLDEFMALAHWKQNRLPVIIVRLFNTVGPRQTGHYGMVLPTFVQRALRGESLHVHGDGGQTRCFCHVEDVVDAIVRLYDHPGARGEVYNVGSTEEVSIADLARRVIQRAGSQSAIEVVPYEKAYGPDGFEDMARRAPCIDKINAAIGWRPTRSLDDIISDVISYTRSSPGFIRD